MWARMVEMMQRLPLCFAGTVVERLRFAGDLFLAARDKVIYISSATLLRAIKSSSLSRELGRHVLNTDN